MASPRYNSNSQYYNTPKYVRNNKSMLSATGEYTLSTPQPQSTKMSRDFQK